MPRLLEGEPAADRCRYENLLPPWPVGKRPMRGRCFRNIGWCAHGPPFMLLSLAPVPAPPMDTMPLGSTIDSRRTTREVPPLSLGSRQHQNSYDATRQQATDRNGGKMEGVRLRVPEGLRLYRGANRRISR